MPQGTDKIVRYLIETYRPRHVLDVGGVGEPGAEFQYAKMFADAGARVTVVDPRRPSGQTPIQINRFESGLERRLNNYLRDCDLVFASHVLEHIQDTLTFLQTLFYFTTCEENALYCVIVPPRKDSLVGGHVNLFTAGSLCYNLILAGQDLSKSIVVRTGYNLAVIGSFKSAPLPRATMRYDAGDIDKLAHLFPSYVNVHEKMDGMADGWFKEGLVG